VRCSCHRTVRGLDRAFTAKVRPLILDCKTNLVWSARSVTYNRKEGGNEAEVPWMPRDRALAAVHPDGSASEAAALEATRP
jgi:hypothetical protein